jgi:ketosteroid isomerase-like protein
MIAAVRRAYDAFSKGDFDAVIELADPEIEFVTTGGLTNVRGADEVRAWMDPDTIEDLTMVAEHFEVAGDNVLVRTRSRGRGAESGIAVEMELWVVWTINDAGLATRIVAYRNDEEAKARQAAGLPD